MAKACFNNLLSAKIAYYDNLFAGKFGYYDKFLYNEAELETYKGAAERVLSISQRGFDFYYFVDKDPESSAMLKQGLSKYEKTKCLEFRSSDANLQIKIPIYWL